MPVDTRSIYGTNNPLLSIYVIYSAEYNMGQITISSQHTPLFTTGTSSLAPSAQRSAFSSMTTGSNAITVTNQSCEESLQLHISETVPNTSAAGFHGCSSIITHVQSRWIVVDDPPGGTSDDPEIKEGNLNQIEEMESAVDMLANDDDTSSGPVQRTYQFDNCHVYINSFNARGVKVKNSGNYAPRVTRLSRSLILFM